MKAVEGAQSFSDPKFLAKLHQRDGDAIASLVRAYTGQLYRASLGLGLDSNSANELVQNVWMTFLDVAPTFQGRSHVRTFIFGILYNKASEIWRERKHYDTTQAVEDVLDKRFDSNGNWLKPPVNPEQFLMASEQLELIEKCIEALPLNQRMAFVLKEVDEEKSPDICKILGVSSTNLGVLLYRARNGLRNCIESKS